jgi:AcrR family transcriptional regulator
MKKQDGYHHGNLRQELLQSARELINERGVEALTLREVARRAGVSDKASLVQALVRESLDRLDAASDTARKDVADPREQLRAIGVAYVRFAVEHPADFRLMFRPELGGPIDFDDPARAPVFRVLAQVVSAIQPAGDAQQHLALAVSAWSLVHGLAALLVDGPLQHMRLSVDQAVRLAEQVTSRLALDDRAQADGALTPS